MNPAKLLVKTLLAIPGNMVHSGDLGLRAPAGVYNVAYSRVLERLESALSDIEEIANSKHNADKLPDFARVLGSYESLVYSLMEYTEDCRSILRSLFDAQQSFHSSKQVRKYDQEVFEYRQHVGNLVNAIKHRQGRLRAVSVYDEAVMIPGFYVETAYSSEAVGPDQNIHNGGETATSLYRNVRYHFVNVFKIAESLDCAIKDIVETSLQYASDSRAEESGEKALDIAKRLQRLPATCFVDELDMADPVIEVVQGEQGSDALHVEMRRPPSQFKTLLKFRVTANFRSDGVSKTYKIPYFGRRAEKLISKKLAQLRSGQRG